jgi:hypothetical protein
MSTVTFDTLELVAKLKTAGIPQEQAEAVVRVIADAQAVLATKQDLKELKADLDKTEFAPIKTDLVVLKWMMGVLLAGVVSLVLKAFF